MSEEDVSALADSLKSDMPAKIVFHSHPNMQAFFSAIDVEVATSPFDDGPTLPVQQLVIGLSEDRIHSAKLFAWSDEEHTFVQIAQYAGATL
jgi:adenylyltransferase/sulfurtransferase